MSPIRPAVVQLVKGHVRWFYRIVASNGQIMTTSQRYYKKANAKRAAMKIAGKLAIEFRER